MALYYHGIHLAIECLALDEDHKEFKDMRRNFATMVGTAALSAGKMLRDQVRFKRQTIREKRQRALIVVGQTVAKSPKAGGKKVRSLLGWSKKRKEDGKEPDH